MKPSQVMNEHQGYCSKKVVWAGSISLWIDLVIIH